MSHHDGPASSALPEEDIPRLCLLHAASASVVMLREAPITIGRDPECAVPVSSHLVSRYHSMVEPAEGQHLLRDLGSTNGTFLNGVRLAGDQAFTLRIGDIIEVGPERFVVSPASAAAGARSLHDDHGSRHDLSDLARDGANHLSQSDLAAFRRESSQMLARAPGRLDPVLELLRARVTAHTLVLYRRGADGGVEPQASVGAELEASGPLGPLAQRALEERRGVLIHGHGEPSQDALDPAETGVHGQWSAAAIPHEDAAVVVVRNGRDRLDRRDLAVLALLTGIVAPSLLRGPAAQVGGAS